MPLKSVVVGAVVKISLRKIKPVPVILRGHNIVASRIIVKLTVVHSDHGEETGPPVNLPILLFKFIKDRGIASLCFRDGLLLLRRFAVRYDSVTTVVRVGCHGSAQSSLLETV